MKINQWTLGLAAAGVVSFGMVGHAEEAKEAVKTALSSTVLSGYVSSSVWFNPGSAGSAAARTAIVPFSTGKGNNFNLDVVDLKLEKPLGEGAWAAGYAAELWFGPDANALGTSSGTFGTPAKSVSADLAIKQAYVNLRIPVGNGIDTKLGVFDTPLGYETPNSGSNPNYTRSFGWAIESTQHTGILASYRFCEWMSATAGIANSSSPVINAHPNSNDSQKTFIGAVTLTAPKSAGALNGATLTAGVIDGRGAAGTTNPDLTSIYVGASIPTPVKGLNLGLTYDLAHQKGSGNDTWASAVYVSYQATTKLMLNLRGDYVDSANAGVAGPTGTGLNGRKILASTLTADYALWANVITRLYPNRISSRNSVP